MTHSESADADQGDASDCQQSGEAPESHRQQLPPTAAARQADTGRKESWPAQQNYQEEEVAQLGPACPATSWGNCRK